MTLLELRNSVKARLGTDHEVTNGQIDQFLNEGYRTVIARITDAFEDLFGASETVALVTGTNEYTPTSDFLSIRHVEVDYNYTGSTYAKAYPIDVTDIKEFDKISTTYFDKSYPQYYFWGTKIGIVPTPDANGTMRIRGIVLPAALSSDADIPAFITTHHHILVTWAHAAMVEAVDQNYLDGARKRQQFEAELEDLINIVKDKQADQNKKIKIRNLY